MAEAPAPGEREAPVEALPEAVGVDPIWLACGGAVAAEPHETKDSDATTTRATDARRPMDGRPAFGRLG